MFEPASIVKGALLVGLITAGWFHFASGADGVQSFHAGLVMGGLTLVLGFLCWLADWMGD